MIEKTNIADFKKDAKITGIESCSLESGDNKLKDNNVMITKNAANDLSSKRSTEKEIESNTSCPSIQRNHEFEYLNDPTTLTDCLNHIKAFMTQLPHRKEQFTLKEHIQWWKEIYRYFKYASDHGTEESVLPVFEQCCKSFIDDLTVLQLEFQKVEDSNRTASAKCKALIDQIMEGLMQTINRIREKKEPTSDKTDDHVYLNHLLSMLNDYNDSMHTIFYFCTKNYILTEPAVSSLPFRDKIIILFYLSEFVEKNYPATISGCSKKESDWLFNKIKNSLFVKITEKIMECIERLHVNL